MGGDCSWLVEGEVVDKDVEDKDADRHVVDGEIEGWKIEVVVA